MVLFCLFFNVYKINKALDTNRISTAYAMKDPLIFHHFETGNNKLTYRESLFSGLN